MRGAARQLEGKDGALRLAAHGLRQGSGFRARAVGEGRVVDQNQGVDRPVDERDQAITRQRAFETTIWPPILGATLRRGDPGADFRCGIGRSAERLEGGADPRQPRTDAQNRIVIASATRVVARAANKSPRRGGHGNRGGADAEERQ